MRILHTIPGLNISSGGPSTCTYHLIRGLNEIGVPTDVLTISGGQNEPKVGAGAFIKEVDDDTFSPLVYSRNMKKFLRGNQGYDLYHANSIWTYPSHITRKVALEADKPFILSPHGMLYPQALQISAWKKKITLALFQRKDLNEATCLHATCMAEMQFIRDFGLKNPVAVIPNCLNISAQPLVHRASENSVRRFGFVGRIHRIKNIDKLLDAWNRLKQKTHDAELLIIGSGDEVYTNELVQYATQNKLYNVRFLGFMTGEALVEQISKLDYLVLPSKSENFGMVVPEGLINRIPVIASKGTPWEELNSHYCGWWVDNDVATLAQTIEQALTISEEDRRSMGERGRALVLEKYTVEKVALKMKQLYEWVVNNGRTPDFIF